jgi:hypothetical protein
MMAPQVVHLADPEIHRDERHQFRRQPVNNVAESSIGSTLTVAASNFGF